jgi:hypothetical protein
VSQGEANRDGRTPGKKGGVLLTLLLLIAAAAAPGPLPPYAESIRCAGLAEGAAGLEDPATARGRRLYDAAIFWGMAASERARKDGLSPDRFTADQKRAAEQAGAELRGGGGGAAAELDRCLERVPPLRR